MNDVFKIDEKPHLGALQERRKNSRKACSNELPRASSGVSRIQYPEARRRMLAYSGF
jgi:hypothetical protein